MAILAGGIVVARRNLKLGRGDRSGANRVALVILACAVANWAIGGRHYADLETEQERLFLLVALGLLSAAFFWGLYLALEPWVRRHWPESLISWTRLLTSGVRDPLVARDVLAGLTLGTLLALSSSLSPVLARTFGYPPEPPRFNGIQLLDGLPTVLAYLLLRIPSALTNGVFFLLLYVVLRRLIPWRFGAPAVFVLVVSVFIGAEGAFLSPNALDLAMGLVFAVVFALPLYFGLLPFAVATFTNQSLNAVPWTVNVGAWYAVPMLVVSATVLALALSAFVMSRAGEPLFGERLFE